jgi:hypothetical protein
MTYDGWAAVFDGQRLRPVSWCEGCGYYFPVHGIHRVDCTNVPSTLRITALVSSYGQLTAVAEPVPRVAWCPLPRRRKGRQRLTVRPAGWHVRHAFSQQIAGI